VFRTKLRQAEKAPFMIHIHGVGGSSPAIGSDIEPQTEEISLPQKINKSLDAGTGKIAYTSMQLVQILHGEMLDAGVV